MKRTEVRVYRDVGGSKTWEFGRPEHATPIARDAQASELIYGPPIDAASRRVPAAPYGAAPRAPDLSALRAGLAKRGLELVSEGCFYWRVVARPKR